MTGLIVRHGFYSNSAPSEDANLVGSIEWNDDHLVTGNVEWANVANSPDGLDSISTIYDTTNAAYTAANAAYTAANSASRLAQNRQTSNYTLVVGDAGKHIYRTGGTITVPTGVFSNGDVIMVFNKAKAAMTIANTGGGATLIQPAANTTGNVTLGGYGLAAIMCVANNINEFTVSGAGIE